MEILFIFSKHQSIKLLFHGFFKLFTSNDCCIYIIDMIPVCQRLASYVQKQEAAGENTYSRKLQRIRRKYLNHVMIKQKITV